MAQAKKHRGGGIYRILHCMWWVSAESKTTFMFLVGMTGSMRVLHTEKGIWE